MDACADFSYGIYSKFNNEYQSLLLQMKAPALGASEGYVSSWKSNSLQFAHIFNWEPTPPPTPLKHLKPASFHYCDRTLLHLNHMMEMVVFLNLHIFKDTWEHWQQSKEKINIQTIYL